MVIGMKKYVTGMIVLLMALPMWAQEAESIDELFRTKYETPRTVDLDAEKDEELLAHELMLEQQKKKKKKNPKIYYGIKTKRGFAKTGFGDKTVLELFFFLKDKDYQGPDKYDREFFWFDFKKKKVVNSLKIKRNNAGVLHGHYVKKMGDQILEEGYFYKGKKHGRWVRYNRNDILQDKENYWKGWPKESLLAYYDFERNDLKEVIPIHYGEREGEYYAYHPNGNLAVVGHYHYDHKVGLWREYYDNLKAKREVRYPLEPFEKNAHPVIVKEWDREGRLIYDRKLVESANR